MPGEEGEWPEVWIKLQAAAASLPRCSVHPDFAAIETLDQKAVNDILSVGAEGIRVRSHSPRRKVDEKLLSAKVFRKWWRYLGRDGHVGTRPGDSPSATDSVIYAAFLVRCLPNLVVRRSDGDLELIGQPVQSPIPADAALPDNDPFFTGEDQDSRPLVERQIRARRGQQQFRNALIDRYGAKCMVTGCEILDILEAAHIKPYRGLKDHDPQNGLLLRADIHTLFDLNLIGVTESFGIKLHPKIEREYRPSILPSLLLTKTSYRPSADALRDRFRAFNS